MKWYSVREKLLFVVGLLGFIHETLFSDKERMGLILAFLAMMGLPVAHQYDLYRKEKKELEEKSPANSSDQE